MLRNVWDGAILWMFFAVYSGAVMVLKHRKQN
jgi:hypothetical protein